MYSKSTSIISVRQGIQNFQQIEHLLIAEQWSTIKLVELDEHEDDKMIFTKDLTGKFSIAKYLLATRVVSSAVNWTRLVWNNSSSIRVNTFMWRVLTNALQWIPMFEGREFA